LPLDMDVECFAVVCSKTHHEKFSRWWNATASHLLTGKTMRCITT
jgi:hypothetical protein